jgi:hypothetical protein
MIDKLQKRFTKQNWVVALKCLIVMYRLMDKGDEKFMKVLKNRQQSAFVINIRPQEGVNRMKSLYT